MEITPILSVDKCVLGKGDNGVITTEIHKLYLEIVKGKVSEFGDYVTAIY